MLNLRFHFFELKFRFFYLFIEFFLTFLVSYFYAEKLIYLYTLPFLKSQIISPKIVLTNFIFTNLSEAFYSYIYISLIISIYFTFLLLLYNFFSYIKIGLFKHEKKILYMFLQYFFIYLNMILVVILKYFLPIFLNFFLSFEKSTINSLFTIRYEAKLVDYIFVNNTIILVSITLFLLPFLLFYLLELNLVSVSVLTKNRRIFILLFFIIGALLSPPDIYSQVLIAFPLFFCFEFIIFFFCLKYTYFK
jgi:sec-independent protein translocase protein TatC